MKTNPEGQARLKRQKERWNETLDRILEPHDPDGQTQKKQKVQNPQHTSAQDERLHNSQHTRSGDAAEGGGMSDAQGKRFAEGEEDQEKKRTKHAQGAEPEVDDEGDQVMETSALERMFQDDFKWTLNCVEDLCALDRTTRHCMVLLPISHTTTKTLGRSSTQTWCNKVSVTSMTGFARWAFMSTLTGTPRMTTPQASS